MVIISDSCCKGSKKVLVNSGDIAIISCEYSQNHINDGKAIFKEGQNSIEELIHTDTLNKEERFSVSDDRHINSFTMRISAVTPDDGGVYLCGVWINRLFYSIRAKVNLHIMSE